LEVGGWETAEIFRSRAASCDVDLPVDRVQKMVVARGQSSWWKSVTAAINQSARDVCRSPESKNHKIVIFLVFNIDIAVVMSNPDRR
jgi:hypothetical protein